MSCDKSFLPLLGSFTSSVVISAGKRITDNHSQRDRVVRVYRDGVVCAYRDGVVCVYLLLQVIPSTASTVS